MARYSNRRGPSSNFELTATNQIVPGLSVTRFLDNGEVFLSVTARVQNGTGITVFITMQVAIDGALQPVPLVAITVPAGADQTATLVGLFPVSRGVHTFDIQARGNAAVGDIVTQGDAMTTLIQLPQWDQTADLAAL